MSVGNFLDMSVQVSPASFEICTFPFIPIGLLYRLTAHTVSPLSSLFRGREVERTSCVTQTVETEPLPPSDYRHNDQPSGHTDPINQTMAQDCRTLRSGARATFQRTVSVCVSLKQAICHPCGPLSVSPRTVVLPRTRQ